MDNVLVELLDKLPQWSYHVFAIIIAFGILMFIVKTFSKDQKINNLIDRSLGLVNGQKQQFELINEMKEKNLTLNHEVSQLATCITNVKELHQTLIKTKMTSSQNEANLFVILLQRAIETLAFDMKAISGEKHRVGIWSRQNDDLLLIRTSSGFPHNYAGHRSLELDRSTAGRCYRKNETINCSDVTKDEDWSPNPHSSSEYKSLICVPLGGWGVLTIDAIQPLSNNCLIISELYASIINEIMLEYIGTMASFAGNEIDFDEGAEGAS